MRNAEEGKQPIDKKYTNEGFFIYKNLLRFVYDSLVSTGKSQKQACEILAPLIQLKPHSVFEHVRRAEPPRKNSYRRKGGYTRLIEFIKQNLVTIVDLRETRKFQKSLDTYVNVNENQKVLVLMKKEYSFEDADALMQCIYGALNQPKKKQMAKFDNPEMGLALPFYYLMLNSRLKGCQIAFAFDKTNLEEAILSFSLPSQGATPYKVSPANQTL